MKHLISAFGMGFLLILSLTTFARADNGKELARKAEFIVSLVDNVTWPDGKGTAQNGAVIIAVVGESPVTPYLKKAAEKRGTGEKKVEIRVIALTDDFSGIQVVFIPTKELTQLASVLKKAAGLPILTISDSNMFAGYGVMVDFLDGSSQGDNPDFAVNKMAMRDVGLSISDTILKLAKKTYG